MRRLMLPGRRAVGRRDGDGTAEGGGSRMALPTTAPDGMAARRNEAARRTAEASASLRCRLVCHRNPTAAPAAAATAAPTTSSAPSQFASGAKAPPPPLPADTAGDDDGRLYSGVITTAVSTVKFRSLAGTPRRAAMAGRSAGVASDPFATKSATAAATDGVMQRTPTSNTQRGAGAGDPTAPNERSASARNSAAATPITYTVVLAPWPNAVVTLSATVANTSSRCRSSALAPDTAMRTVANRMAARADGSAVPEGGGGSAVTVDRPVMAGERVSDTVPFTDGVPLWLGVGSGVTEWLPVADGVNVASGVIDVVMLAGSVPLGDTVADGDALDDSVADGVADCVADGVADADDVADGVGVDDGDALDDGVADGEAD